MIARRRPFAFLSSNVPILVAAALLLVSPSRLVADACTDPPPAGLNGTVVGTECQVNSSVTAQTTYNFAAGPTLHVCAPGGTCATPTLGTITVPPAAGGNNLTLNLTGSLIMDTGASIVGDVFTAGGIGANITINAFNVLLHGNGTDGAKITSNNI